LISDGYTTFQRPHNDVLWAFCETGIFGGLIYLTLLVCPIVYGTKTYLKTSQKSEKVKLLWIIWMLIGYVFVALVDFPFERPEHQIIWALAVAYVFKPYGFVKTISLRVLIILSLSITIVGFYGLNRLPNEVHAKKIVQAQMTSNWQMLLKEAKKINYTFYSIDNFSIPISWYVGVAHYSLSNGKEAKKAFHQAYETNPYQIHVLNNMASMFEMEGDHVNAIKYYDELLQISPKQPDALLNKSAVLFNSNRKLEAAKCIYQFKYDESNTQFLTYLHSIFLWHMEEQSKVDPSLKDLIPENSKECPQIIKDIFRINQRQNVTFEKINFQPNEH